MKLSTLRKGFTLVEIMIVVVIIGILATLAVPALKKARNSAVEKSLFNDSRQISSAANQYFAEKGASSVTLGQLIGPNNYLSSLSSGTMIKEGGGAVTATTFNTITDLWAGTAGQAVTLTTSSDPAGATKAVFRLANIGYDTSLSGTPLVNDPAQGKYNADQKATAKDIGLTFGVETGTLIKNGLSDPTKTAAYQG